MALVRPAHGFIDADMGKPGTNANPPISGWLLVMTRTDFTMKLSKKLARRAQDGGL
jgi:hypothetical protein